MQQPAWQERDTLGAIFARSTSEPPPMSDDPKNTGGSLVGNDLLDQLTNGYTEYVLSGSATPLMSNGAADMNRNESGHRSDGSDNAGNPLQQYEFQHSNNHSSRNVQMNRENDFNLGLGGADRMGLNRSQSAQPVFHHAPVRTPPGLLPSPTPSLSSSPMQQQQHHHHQQPIRPSSVEYIPQHSLVPDTNVRRSNSTGGLPNSNHRSTTTLRPAAKTLMDLIQEEYPADDHQQHQQSLHHDPRVGSPLNRTSPVSPEYSKYRSSTASHQPLQPTFEPNFGSNVQQRQMNDRPPLSPSHGQRYTQIPHQHGNRQQGMDNLQYQMNGLNVQDERSMHQVPQSSLPSMVSQDQLYYNIQQRQVIQPGQTMIVNGPNGQQQAGYSVPTLQYQPSVQTRMVIGNVGEQQYMSVVPIQNGSQVAYWPDELQQQQVAVVHAQKNTPMSISRSIQEDPQIPLGRGRNNNNNNMGGGDKVRGGNNGGRRNGRKDNGGKNSSQSASSPVLEEFRQSKTRDWSLQQIEGYVVEFCQDQNGSRFIQQRLEMGDPREQQIVMKEVLPAIRRLRNDVFGNYVVQKLLDFGTVEMKESIRNTLEGEMLQLSLQMYGCRVVQKALEALDHEDIPRMLSEFHHNVLSCIHDQNGNHVIQKCIEVVSNRSKKAAREGDDEKALFFREQIDFIVNDILVNTLTLSCHPYGCRVLQRILEHCDEQKRVEVLDEIKKCHSKLLDDQYGNYVIQHVLQFGRSSDRDSILQIIVDNGLLGLSRQKFASNVVEKLLKHGNGAQRRAIAREMVKKPNGQSDPTDKSTVILMVRDAYANYVVQTTLDVIPESDEKQVLLRELNAHSDDLKNYTFAKHIVTKLATLNSSNQH